MRKLSPEIQAMIARREREVRTVQAVIGAVSGFVGGGVLAARCYASGPIIAVSAVAAAIAGALAGWQAPPWQTAVDRPGIDDGDE